MIKTQNKIKSQTILFTLAGIIIYFLANNISYLLVNPEASNYFYDNSGFSKSLTLFNIGISPFISGFLLIELISFFIPILKKWRNSGLAGRAKLTHLSYILGIIFVFIQSYALSSFVASNSSASDSIYFFISLILFFSIGSILNLLLANWLTDKGLINGYALLILFELFIRLKSKTLEYLNKIDQSGYKFNFLGLVFLFFILLFVFQFLKKNSNQSEIVIFENKPINFELAPLIISIESFAYSDTILSTIFGYFTIANNSFIAPFLTLSWSYAILNVSLFFLLSWFFYTLFFKPTRIKNCISNIVTPHLFEEKTFSFFKKTTLIFSLILFLMSIQLPFVENTKLVLPFISVADFILIYFIFKDMFDYYKFLQQEPEPVCICNLDNIHLATVIKENFKNENIHFYIKSFEIKRLFSFFCPFIKMQIIVKKDQEKLAREIINLENIKII